MTTSAEYPSSDVHQHSSAYRVVGPCPVRSNECVFSIDVEDWFHLMDLPHAPALSNWSSLPSVVERNFSDLLDMLEAGGVKATCFFLGWIAERYPHLVRRAIGGGHEVASHGYAHQLVYEMSPADFLADISRAKHCLEGISGGPVQGYRAPGFSVTSATPWFFQQVAAAGYTYSSSIFPGPRQHGGLPGFASGPSLIHTSTAVVSEIPISVVPIFGAPVCFFGGGYLRLFPYAAIRRMANRVLASGHPVIFYVHPREIDPTHPRLRMPLARRFKSYVGLSTTRPKIQNLIRDFKFSSFANLLRPNIR